MHTVIYTSCCSWEGEGHYGVIDNKIFKANRSFRTTGMLCQTCFTVDWIKGTAILPFVSTTAWLHSYNQGRE